MSDKLLKDATAEIPFNLNGYITCILNERGKKAMHDYWKKLGFEVPPERYADSAKVRMQMHEFISVFGNSFGPSFGDIPLESMDVVLENAN